jgi:acyl carrier protein
MSRDATKQHIRGFLALHLGDRDLADADDIFALGYVNSLFAMQLVAFVEKQFDIVVESEDLDFANFRSVGALADLVEVKTSMTA